LCWAFDRFCLTKFMFSSEKRTQNSSIFFFFPDFLDQQYLRESESDEQQMEKWVFSPHLEGCVLMTKSGRQQHKLDSILKQRYRETWETSETGETGETGESLPL